MCREPMTEDKIPWWTHVIAALVVALLFAAVPFWTHGLSVSDATICAGVIFPVVVAFYVYAIWRESRRG
jgi:hypothetical protein